MTDQVIGILGGGQLGRMLALAGYPLGLHVRVLDPSPEAPCHEVAEHIVGAYEDTAMLEHFVQGVDVVTYEFENVPVESAHFLTRFCPVYPPPEALTTAQDRLFEKRFFRALDIPTATFVAIDSVESLHAALARFGLPAMLKTRRFGYDGKGQIILSRTDDVARAWDMFHGVPLILESLVPFDRELSIVAVRNVHGATAFYPLVENVHQRGILHYSIAPAPRVSPALQATAEDYAARVLDRLSYVGVLAIELFQFGDSLLANEMAPRVHNSGHWSIEGAATSQFANHMRAIVGLPLGSTDVFGYSVMVNSIGTLPDISHVLANSAAHVHIYNKSPRPGRKLGHITYRAHSLAQALQLAECHNAQSE